MSKLLQINCRRQLCHGTLLKYVDEFAKTTHVCGIKTSQSQELARKKGRFKTGKVINLRAKASPKKLEDIVKPRTLKSVGTHSESVGAELSGELDKAKVLEVMQKFVKQKEVIKFAEQHGIDNYFFHKTFISFRKYCKNEKVLPAELHILLSDICAGAGHVDDLLPHFIKHAKEIFPHLESIDHLKVISDLRDPANWYSEARNIERKIIFHAGPTNSGKTYQALQRFMQAETGVYCGPLKLLAAEVHKKCNEQGTPCDLITGEERKYANPEGEPSKHIACTVEMSSLTTPYEVAVIDEIQMVRDQQRGWAWTRALLGINAKEIHVCGEPSAIKLVQEMAMDTGDFVEVKEYERLTGDLAYLDEAVENFDNIQPGDCIVCFSRNDIYHINRQLELRGIQSAVIYGGLPPGAKLAQSEKFNDPKDPCKVMVATDAVGMGLNLHIKRIVFYSIMKPKVLENGEKEIDVIDTSLALQIAGRAGRYGSEFEQGHVTTFKRSDLPVLKKIISQSIEQIQKAGLHPTAEQIELFAYHLPGNTLTQLIDIFINLSQLDRNIYFLCNLENFKLLASTIEHIALPLRDQYTLCCSPIPKDQPFVCNMFVKFAHKLYLREPLTFDWLCQQLNVEELVKPRTISDLLHLENIFDVLDLYKWLRYRFPDMFPDYEIVSELQNELDKIIQEGVQKIAELVQTSRAGISENLDKIKVLFNNEKIPNEKNSQWTSKSDDPSLSPLSGVDHEKVSDYLLKSNIITPELLSKLQAEWTQEYLNKTENQTVTDRKTVSHSTKEIKTKNQFTTSKDRNDNYSTHNQTSTVQTDTDIKTPLKNNVTVPRRKTFAEQFLSVTEPKKTFVEKFLKFFNSKPPVKIVKPKFYVKSQTNKSCKKKILEDTNPTENIFEEDRNPTEKISEGDRNSFQNDHSGEKENFKDEEKSNSERHQRNMIYKDNRLSQIWPSIPYHHNRKDEIIDSGSLLKLLQDNKKKQGKPEIDQSLIKTQNSIETMQSQVEKMKKQIADNVHKESITRRQSKKVDVPLDLLHDVILKCMKNGQIVIDLKECVQAVERDEAKLCIIAENLEEDQSAFIYRLKLIQMLCENKNISLIQIDRMILEEWITNYQSTIEHFVGEPVCIVVKDYGVESKSLDVLIEYLKPKESQ